MESPVSCDEFGLSRKVLYEVGPQRGGPSNTLIQPIFTAFTVGNYGFVANLSPKVE